MKKEYKKPNIVVCDLHSEVSMLAQSTEDVKKGRGYDPDSSSPTSGYSWVMLPLMMLSLFSCSSGDGAADGMKGDVEAGPQSEMVQMTLCASQEENGITKAQFTPNGDSRKVTWQTGDMVSVMYSTGSNRFAQQFTLSNGAGTTVGEFVGQAHQSAGALSVMYPYQGQVEYVESNGTAYANRVVLPTVQMATTGSFDPHAAIMMGQARNTWTSESLPISFPFRNVCSFIEVTPEFDCSSIIVSTRMPGEYLSGCVRVDNGDIPTVNTDGLAFTGTGANKVTLTGGISAGHTYYIAVIPGTLNNGLRVTCVGSDGRMATKRISSAVTLERGKYHSFTSFLSNPSSAEVDGVDLGTGDGVLWAQCNVGATAPHEFGDEFAWGDVMPLYSYDPSNVYLNANGSYYKSEDKWGNYKWGDGNNVQTPTSITFSKYNSVSSTLVADDDAARRNLGGNWRMPTVTEINNIIEKCDWEYASNYNGTGVSGYIVSNKKDNTKSIFLPMAKEIAYYWSNLLDENDNKKAKAVVLTDSSHDLEPGDRVISSFIRPVR